MVATVSSPFDSFARWVQGRLVENDLVLPPDA